MSDPKVTEEFVEMIEQCVLIKKENKMLQLALDLAISKNENPSEGLESMNELYENILSADPLSKDYKRKRDNKLKLVMKWLRTYLKNTYIIRHGDILTVMGPEVRKFEFNVIRGVLNVRELPTKHSSLCIEVDTEKQVRSFADFIEPTI